MTVRKLSGSEETTYVDLEWRKALVGLLQVSGRPHEVHDPVLNIPVQRDGVSLGTDGQGCGQERET